MVRSEGRIALIDTGPEPEPLRRCLQELGVTRIDLLVLTHFSSRYPDLTGHLREASAVFPDVIVATDLAIIGFPERTAPSAR